MIIKKALALSCSTIKVSLKGVMNWHFYCLHHGRKLCDRHQCYNLALEHSRQFFFAITKPRMSHHENPSICFFFSVLCFKSVIKYCSQCEYGSNQPSLNHSAFWTETSNKSDIKCAFTTIKIWCI